MRNAFIFIAALVLLPPVVRAAESLPWAYPLSAPGTALSTPDPAVQHVPGSTKGYTQAQIDDNYNAVDWFPAEHPSMPEVVEHGSSPIVWACAKCHLANGLGHPESASLAGLPAAYIARQITAYKDGSRTGGYEAMARIAKGLTDDQTEQAAAWFSTLTTRPWIRVLETAVVPKTYVGSGNMRAVSPGSEIEPLGERIIEIPENVTLTTLRDPHSGTIAYVPRGSIAHGKLLVTTGGGETTRCVTCHGANLKGVADIPSIAGRSPTYIFRQIHDIQSGTRSGPNVALMQDVVARLTNSEMIAISAYLASLQP